MSKNVLLLTLKLLENVATEQKPLSQTAIAKQLTEMNHPCDRKTVGRHIAHLKEMRYPIIKTPGGYYLSVQRFSKEEIRLVELAIRAQTNEKINVAELASRVRQVLQCAYTR